MTPNPIAAPTDSAELADMLEDRATRRADRRAFFKAAAGAAVAGAALGWASAAEAQTVTDADILNFALNLEYLEAQFYSFAVNGAGLGPTLLTGSGKQGAVTGGRAVDFSGDPIIGRMAREIAADEAAHVAYLRGQLGTATVVAQPALDISASATGAFSKVAQAAGIVAAGVAFDPYASIDNFLLAAYVFEDVGVTAYKGAAPLITSKAYLEAAAGILAVEAYHAATLRTQLFNRGQTNANLITYAQGISDARDSLDGATDIDQGITPGSTTITNADATTTTLAVSNIVPTDQNAVVYSRTTGQVLNIAYITSTAATVGGFFPAGVNGTIATSTAE
ncbi:ferritin-like domain-containing protein [Sphingomonas bacterium]|uniref:ferritin-like domain-containing protein n=1 Tax=Sphingomonas bacterium TaxID=1895847 RepID=UPI0015756307|nr:ferritin-like domain-containing protein [Sphingomonas bacterium]